MTTSGVTRKITGSLAGIRQATDALTRRDVLVGVPSTTAGDRDGGPINNAALAYIHDNGAPEANVPARPFMEPGIDSIEDDMRERMRAMGRAAAEGRATAVEQGKQALGMVAASAVKNQINSNIPPPLAPSTIAGRARQRGTGRRKSEDKYLGLVAGGVSPGVAQQRSGIVALVNTGKMRNAISYVVRDRK